MREELVCEMLQQFVSNKTIGPNSIHPRVLTELADVTARLLLLIFENLWRSLRDAVEIKILPRRVDCWLRWSTRLMSALSTRRA